MANLADAAATLGDSVAGSILIEIGPGVYANQVIVPAGSLVLGAIARPLGRVATVLGDHDKAEAWFAMGHDMHTRLHAPFWTARGELDHADLCLARNADSDLERARQLATTAAAVATEYGCKGLTQRAAALLSVL